MISNQIKELYQSAFYYKTYSQGNWAYVWLGFGGSEWNAASKAWIIKYKWFDTKAQEIITPTRIYLGLK